MSHSLDTGEMKPLVLMNCQPKIRKFVVNYLNCDSQYYWNYKFARYMLQNNLLSDMESLVCVNQRLDEVIHGYRNERCRELGVAAKIQFSNTYNRLFHPICMCL